jgi:tetratricopeptide (TPR) repeat protein
MSRPSAAEVAKANQYRQQGLNYRQAGNYAQAIVALKQSVKLDPGNLSSSVILGWTEHLAGQPQLAAQTLQAVLAKDPKYVPALNALGIVYLVDGQLDQAVQTHQQAAKLKPDNEIAYYNLSLAYQRLKQHDLAVDNAERATKLEAENPHPWIALAIAHWSKGEKTVAQKSYRQAITVGSHYGDRANLSELRQAGFSPEQIQTAEQILQTLNP